MGKHVAIRNISADAVVMAALGGEISTQQGNTFELFNKRINMDYNKNVDLINKVIKSGHTSILEHVTFSFLLTNVSVCVEEFFIEHRLASFTVKSRRYVDFSNPGYYLPDDFPSEEFRRCYIDDMDHLFITYSDLLNLGVPKEDARFILPYSFYSNFICTVNAREAIHIVTDLYKKGFNGLKYDECDNEYLYLYAEIMHELKSSLPWLHDIICVEINKYESLHEPEETKVSENMGEKFIEKPSVSIDNCTSVHARDIVRKKLLYSNYAEENPRELELLNYFIQIDNVSLATITHLVRHRMQSIIVPELSSVSTRNFIVPKSISDNDETMTVYKRGITTHLTARDKMMSIDHTYYSRSWFNQYIRLSGNTTTVGTSMNGRELLKFIQLRTCNRAQWEIQGIANEVLRQIRERDDIFNLYGPSCYVQGACPEGRMCCGREREMKAKYRPEYK